MTSSLRFVIKIFWSDQQRQPNIFVLQALLKKLPEGGGESPPPPPPPM